MLELTNKQKEECVKTARDMSLALRNATGLMAEKPWQQIFEGQRLKIYRADHSKLCNIHAASRCSAQMEVVAKSLITSTDESYKSMMSTLSGDFVDGVVLCNILQQTKTAPYRHVALKWAAFKSNSSPFTKYKDFVILEVCTRFFFPMNYDHELICFFLCSMLISWRTKMEPNMHFE